MLTTRQQIAVLNQIEAALEARRHAEELELQVAQSAAAQELASIMADDPDAEYRRQIVTGTGWIEPEPELVPFDVNAIMMNGTIFPR